MLTILDKKGKQGVCGVIQALKEDYEHTGHDELASVLEKAYGFPDLDRTSKYQRHNSSYPVFEVWLF